MTKPSSKLPQVVNKNFSTAEIDLLRETYAKGLNDVELRVFLKQCEVLDLNPFNKEVYGIKVGQQLVLMTSIGGYRKIAHRSNHYLGCKTTELRSKDGKLISTTSTVKKIVGNRVAEFEFVAMMDEFNQGSGKWKSMPRNQLAKCSEAGALKMAFSNIQNLHDEAELSSIPEDEPTFDAAPDYENETQEIEINAEGVVDSVPGPGEYLVKFGSRKSNPTKIKDIPIQELNDFVSWCYGQEKLTEGVKEYLTNAEAFLETSLNGKTQ